MLLCVHNGDFFGKLKYNDKAGTKLDGTDVTDFKQTGAKSRQIVGAATLNGGATVTYTPGQSHENQLAEKPLHHL